MATSPSQEQPVPQAWLVPLTALLGGIAIGLGGFTFVYAEGHSYLTNDPRACANCHIMDDHYAAWFQSSHAHVAVCNDCHTPPDGLLRKYAVKAKNGFWHSFYFTTGGFHDPIRITRPNHDVVEGACRHCHERIAETVDHGGTSRADGATRLACTHCHQHVGHLVR